MGGAIAVRRRASFDRGGFFFLTDTTGCRDERPNGSKTQKSCSRGVVLDPDCIVGLVEDLLVQLSISGDL
jgi:hypothetical protein